jgi:hypothetical protein
VHPQLTFGDDAQALPARCVANFALQPRALALELVSLSVERSKPLRLADAKGSPPYDGQRDQNESSKDQRHEGSPS